VLVELALAALVLSVTGFLVSQPPGRSAVVESPSVSASTAIDAERSVTLTVDPGRHGVVSVDLTLTGGAVPEQVTVTASLTSQQLGPLPVPLVRSGPSTYHADDVLLPAAGQWTFTIAVRASEFDAVTTNVPISIS
jgi:copper transport protein